MFGYHEEKWYIILLKLIKDLFLCFLIFTILMIIIGIIVAYVPVKKYHYEYIDLDNNNGNAKECSYKFEEYKSGGQGSPVCELEDGTIKQVKEYKYIYEGEYLPIKEIIGDDKQ